MTKWCPFGRRYIFDELNYGSVATAINEPKTQYEQLCIAPDCMMWIKTLSYEDTASGSKKIDGGRCGLCK